MDPAKARGGEAECAEGSFGVRAACCRFLGRKLASGPGGALVPWPSRPSPLHGRDARGINQFAADPRGINPPPACWRIRQERQQAGGGKSGSKLHALQSFARSARRGAGNFCVPMKGCGLLVSQSDHGIDFHRPAGRDVTGK